MQILDPAWLSEILRSSDSPEKYSPHGFDFKKAYEKAVILGKEISNAIKINVQADNPSLFQDGSIFTRLTFNYGDPKNLGQVVISSFGNLVVVVGVNDLRLKDVINGVISRFGYIIVSYDDLNFKYNGSYECFNKMTWGDRFFSSFYDPLDFR